MLGAGLAIAAVLVVADQILKVWIMGLLGPGQRIIDLAPFAKLVTVWNRGVSFGLFNQPDGGLPSWVFISVAGAISLGLLVWLARAESRLVAVALATILGGAIGNVIDRFRYGAVFDFMVLHAGQWSWPAFNLADAAICVGAGILIWDGLFTRPRSTK